MKSAPLPPPMTQQQAAQSIGSLATSLSNTLFIRNLSPDITESVIRQVFSPIDQIMSIKFKLFPNSQNSFYAEVVFRTSKGVLGGTKISGTSILGVPMQCGIMDPAAQRVQENFELTIGQQKAKESQAALLAATPGTTQYLEALAERKNEAVEAQLMRTIYVSGLPKGVTDEDVQFFFKKYGPIAAKKMENDINGEPFALIEFEDVEAADEAKLAAHTLVNGQAVEIAQARTAVSSVQAVEAGVQFEENPIGVGVANNAELATRAFRSEKLAKVRQIAAGLTLDGTGSPKAKESSSSSSSDSDSSSSSDSSASKKKKKKKKRGSKRKKRSRSRSRRRR